MYCRAELDVMISFAMNHNIDCLHGGIPNFSKSETLVSNVYNNNTVFASFWFDLDINAV